MKSQASIEYFALIGIVIVAVSLIAMIGWEQSETSSRVQQASIAANIIASTADSLYAQGPGARTSIKIIIPSGYSPSRSSIENNLVVLSVNTAGGYMDVVASTKANISGSLPTTWGMKIIYMQTIEGYVNITSS